VARAAAAARTLMAGSLLFTSMYPHIRIHVYDSIANRQHVDDNAVDEAWSLTKLVLGNNAVGGIEADNLPFVLHRVAAAVEMLHLPFTLFGSLGPLPLRPLLDAQLNQLIIQ
jgi:hypothetical protein